jgi:hypothetical protein
MAGRLGRRPASRPAGAARRPPVPHACATSWPPVPHAGRRCHIPTDGGSQLSDDEIHEAIRQTRNLRLEDRS